MDFISGSLDCGRKFGTLNVIDDFNREDLTVDAGFSFPGIKVIRLLDYLIYCRGKPAVIKVYNALSSFLMFCHLVWKNVYYKLAMFNQVSLSRKIQLFIQN